MNFYSYRYMLWHGGRQSATADAAINYTEHDKRYHHGNFDPKTMTCEMREAEAEGDLVDVLNAEQEEAEYQSRKNQKERKEDRKKKADDASKARSAEIHRKTIAELASREYTNIDRGLVNDAISHVLSMKPVDVEIEAAKEARKTIGGKEHFVKELEKYFKSKYPDGIKVPDVGVVEVSDDSAGAVYAHKRSGFALPTAAIFSKLVDLLQKAKPYAVFPKWKGRAETSISLCSSMKLGGGDEFIVEFVVNRKTTGVNYLYAVKWFRKEEVEGGFHHVAAAMGNRGASPLSTTAHSISNSGGGVNRDITEKSRGQSESPRLPSSNLLRQYIAANGLLGQYASP